MLVTWCIMLDVRTSKVKIWYSEGKGVEGCIISKKMHKATISEGVTLICE